MSPWEKLLEQPHSRGHFVQLYEADEGALTRNVGLYLWEGLRRGDGVLVIATPEHQELFSTHLNDLGADITALVESRQLVFCDAQQTLNRFMLDGQPDWHAFESVIGEAMRRVRPVRGAEGLRAYGEMVGILWKARQFASASRLEHLWNRLLEQSSFSLYCAYAIDVFGKEFQVANLDSVLSTHTHLIPAQPDGTLESALNRSMDEILGPEADALRVLIKANPRPAWAVMPTAEATVLWLRRNLPQQSDEIITRAQHYYHSPLQTVDSALTAE
ncbi:MAG TPA: MEDS domain-containing protein [Bryobacteraceae bacterium]|nr:MEDS domain-containing protein [Bryobacteraceae bacterium]